MSAWNPSPGDHCLPKGKSAGSYAVVIQSDDDTVVFDRYDPGMHVVRLRNRLSTFLSRYEHMEINLS